MTYAAQQIGGPPVSSQVRTDGTVSMLRLIKSASLHRVLARSKPLGRTNPSQEAHELFGQARVGGQLHSLCNISE